MIAPQPPSDATRSEVLFSTGEDAPARARAWLDGRFDGTAARRLRPVVSELVAQAVERSDGAAGAVRLAVTVDGDRAFVEVSGPRHGRPLPVSGLRAALLDGVAEHWTDGDDGGLLRATVRLDDDDDGGDGGGGQPA